MNQQAGATAVDVASMPWAFTQQRPLDTSEFIDEAQKRGIRLDLAILRELYRRRLLIPFAQITRRRVRPAATPNEHEPMLGGTRLMDLRSARDTGRLRDLSTLPYLPRLSFQLSRETWPTPWNGLLYSRYQLLILPELESVLAKRTSQKRGGRVIARLPQPHSMLLDRAEKLHKMVVALTAVEARYLPKLDPEFVQLHDAFLEEWEPYRKRFDPVYMRDWLQYTADQVRQDAEWQLFRAHDVDPVGADWSQLMRRAPLKARKQLKDAALQAMDARVAAEILLLFYEDLARRGEAASLPALSGMYWHPLHERLSKRSETLDENLIRLGISPHPRVVLALEGETEMYHAPLVWRALECADAPELLRLLKLGGVNQGLTKVAALTAAPLVSGRVPDINEWNLIKPYTRLLIAIDPEGPFATPEKVEKERIDILNEIRDVLKAQGVTRPNPKELNELIDIRTWQESCYEFAHFKDEELAEGIMAVHDTINGWSRDELVEALGYWRSRKDDIKRVWTSGRWDEQSKKMTGKWEHGVSKVELAKALWPTLERKIERLKTDDDAPMPPIAKIMLDAYHLAQQWRYISFLLTEEPSTPTADVATSDSSDSTPTD